MSLVLIRVTPAHLICVSDIATLSRMTGKDFSGPTPDIRAPTPVRMPELPEGPPKEVVEAELAPVKKRRGKKAAKVDDVEILGDIDEMAKEDIALDF